ncbi:T9SS type A sorting domain-containing protein [Ulvibacter litoralis]|uniref:Por secretion system C-terminal sorting domain-containing protein n=1 Tax=Ulvibacter litoralis TaxID=227084 RepID=A0A1G7GLI1_9FLAO|nr:T9SS type A sorting domain-containing protein [Ulvibacter litoralis]GHC55742.1 hypothetical protein GCM10008083_20100 [Ulvibacter litoralis]SDE88982.1 Por secretion system C-terminal sorting domain-containing protein [Ulvibacter litoralis]
MKKITVIFLFAFGTTFAQQAESFSEVLSNSSTTVQTTSNQEAVVISGGDGAESIIDTYTTLNGFSDAVGDNCSDTTLTSEDFAGGPSGITECGIVISNAGDGCYAAGELELGFDVMASNSTNVISIPGGAIGNVDPLVGANTFTEYTIINFAPDVYAVGMDLWENSDPSVDIRVFGTGGALIDVLTIAVPVGVQTFFGVIADEPITKMEIEGINGSGELFGNFLFGADCGVAGVNDTLLSQVSVYPNPASDVLNVRVPATVEVKNAVLYDVLGKDTGARLVNGSLDIADLARGVYILNINTTAGSLTEKVVKN